jgi:hypothetical protein
MFSISRVFTVVIILVLAACSENESNVELLKAEVLQLEQAKLTFEHASVPKKWGAGLFVANKDIDEALSTLIGLEAAKPSEPSLSFEVSDVSVAGTPGAVRASLSVDARKEELEAGLTVDAAVHYVRTELRGSDTVAIFGLRILSIEPTGIASYIPWWDDNLVEDPRVQVLLRTYLAKYEFPLKTARELSLPIDYNRTETVATDDDKGSFQITISSPASAIKLPVAMAVPLPTAKGLWLLGQIDGKPVPTFDPLRLPKDVAALQARKKELEIDLADLEKAIPATFAQSGVWLSASAFAKLGEGFNALSDDERKVSFMVGQIKGNLVEKMSGPNHLKGGYRATLTSGNGALQLGKSNFVWNQGAELRFNAAAHVSAKVDVHFDPYVGGGFTDNVSIGADANTPARIGYAPRLVTAGGHSALAVGALFNCQQVPVTVQGGGSLKFGIRTDVTLFDQSGKPQLLVRDYQPILVNLKQSVEKNGLAWRGKGPAIWHIIVQPQEPVTVNDGYWLPVALKSVPRAPDPQVTRSVRTIDDALAAQWQTMTQPTCPQKSATKFLFAGQDFGPNNTFVKLLNQFASNLKRHGATLAQAKDRIATVVKDPSKIDDVAKDVRKSVKEQLRRTRDDLRHPDRWAKRNNPF